MLLQVESAIALTPRDFEAGTTARPCPCWRVARIAWMRACPLRPGPAGLVPRLRVVRRLLEARELPVALLVAPAGYGKTTVLSEWSEWDARPFAWVRLDGDDRHPARLLASIAGALGVRSRRLHRYGRTRPGGRCPGCSGTSHTANSPWFSCSTTSRLLHGSAALPFVQAIADGMPPGSQLALASRHEPALAVGSSARTERWSRCAPESSRWRARRQPICSKRPGCASAPPSSRQLVRRTEGWAAGLYLAALSLRDDRDVPHGGVTIRRSRSPRLGLPAGRVPDAARP